MAEADMEIKRAKISVLVPVYNVERYLRRCLDSILAQTFPELEILCLDDGSTDASGAVLDEYAGRDSRIKVIHKENTGYGNTMNLAITMAEGEYIGIVESDDYIMPDMYKEMYAVAEQWKLDFVKTDFYKFWEREDGSEQLDNCSLTGDMGMYDRVMEPNSELESYFMEKFTWNALYRRSFLVETGIRYNETPGASYQDNGFWFQTFYFAKRVMFLNQAFYCYKQDNPDSSIHSDGKIYAMKEEYDFIRNFLVKQNETDQRFYKICFHFRIAGYIYTLTMLADQHKQRLAEIFAEECDGYEKTGEAVFDYFSPDRQQIIRQIRKNPISYAEKCLQVNKRNREKIAGYPYVIVYGAGSYGKQVYETVKLLREPCIVELAVTCLEGKKQYYHNKIIKEIKEFAGLGERCLVILSVKFGTSAYHDMERVLRHMGFKHVITYREIRW